MAFAAIHTVFRGFRWHFDMTVVQLNASVWLLGRIVLSCEILKLYRHLIERKCLVTKCNVEFFELGDWFMGSVYNITWRR